jgi:hypothetical protein
MAKGAGGPWGLVLTTIRQGLRNMISRTPALPIGMQTRPRGCLAMVLMGVGGIRLAMCIRLREIDRWLVDLDTRRPSTQRLDPAGNLNGALERRFRIQGFQ